MFLFFLHTFVHNTHIYILHVSYILNALRRSYYLYIQQLYIKYVIFILKKKKKMFRYFFHHAAAATALLATHAYVNSHTNRVRII